MKIIIARTIEIWKKQFWLTPALIIVLLVSLQFLVEMIPIDRSETSLAFLILSSMSAEGSRLILSAIAGSLITVVGVLFSITILVVAQLATTYSPRVIQNFVKSIPSQVVLGFYVGTFTYCLLLLRRVHGDQGEGPDTGQAFIPHLGISVAIGLAVICLGLLIYYIHHLTHSFQSSTLLKSIRKETLASIDRVYETSCPSPREHVRSLHARYPFNVTIFAREAGYVQTFTWREMDSSMSRGHWFAELLVTPGDFVHQGTPVVTINSLHPLSQKECDNVWKLFRVGSTRTYAQDASFGVRQIVDIALRGLSPSTNDPATAGEALNEIGAILHHYTQLPTIATPVQLEEGGLIAMKQPSYDDFVSLCFDQIILSASGHPAILIQMLQIVHSCRRYTRDLKKLAALGKKQSQIATVIRESRDLVPFQADLAEQLDKNAC